MHAIQDHTFRHSILYIFTLSQITFHHCIFNIISFLFVFGLGFVFGVLSGCFQGLLLSLRSMTTPGRLRGPYGVSEIELDEKCAWQTLYYLLAAKTIFKLN